MKLIIQNERIAATATDAYTGPEFFIDAPADFDSGRMGEYRYEGGGVLALHSVPYTCTRRQGKLALLHAGMLDAAEAAIEGIADPTQRRAAQIEYEADTWERANPFLQALWAGLGGTEQELDALFVDAGQR